MLVGLRARRGVARRRRARIDPVMLDSRRRCRRRSAGGCRRARRRRCCCGNDAVARKNLAAAPALAPLLGPRPVVGSVARFLVRARNRPERGRNGRRYSGIGRQEVGRRTAGRRAVSVGVLHLLFLHAPREPCRTLHALRSSLLPSRLAATAAFTKWRGRFSFPGKSMRPGPAPEKGFPAGQIRLSDDGKRFWNKVARSSRRRMQWKTIFLAGRRMRSRRVLAVAALPRSARHLVHRRL